MWKNLLGHLPQVQLEIIEVDGRSISHYCQSMFDYWMTCTLNPTWDELLSTLIEISSLCQKTTKAYYRAPHQCLLLACSSKNDSMQNTAKQQ